MQAQKERNILKHQSVLLLADMMGDDKVMRLLQEVEVLKRTLEEEQQRHMTELQELQVYFWRQYTRWCECQVMCVELDTLLFTSRQIT